MIPADWSGPAVVIASGPSLLADDVEFCRGRAKVIVVNDNHRLAPWADLLYAADGTWWRHYRGVPDFTGEKWCAEKNCAEQFGLNWIPVDPAGQGFSADPKKLHRLGANSGGHAVNLAMLRGAGPIYLLGFDMQVTAGCKHWFGSHPKPLDRASNYVAWRKAMDAAAGSAPVEIINCSRRSALTAYRRADIRECL